MRMWNVDPKVMCRQHLLGEHLEMHMYMGTIRKGISIRGYLEKGLVETHNIRTRHDTLAAEMIARGYAHKSPMLWDISEQAGCVDVEKNSRELFGRCEKCREGSYAITD